MILSRNLFDSSFQRSDPDFRTKERRQYIASVKAFESFIFVSYAANLAKMHPYPPFARIVYRFPNVYHDSVQKKLVAQPAPTPKTLPELSGIGISFQVSLTLPSLSI